MSRSGPRGLRAWNGASRRYRIGLTLAALPPRSVASPRAAAEARSAPPHLRHFQMLGVSRCSDSARRLGAVLDTSHCNRDTIAICVHENMN